MIADQLELRLNTRSRLEIEAGIDAGLARLRNTGRTYTAEEIGRECGVSHAAISQITTRALEKVRKGLEDLGMSAECLRDLS